MVPCLPGRPARALARSLALLLALSVAAAVPRAWARVEVFDRGPTLRAGKFIMRVSNAGILGNPFPDLSTDPSFEYPQGSGQEMMLSASLWVGAVDALGEARVSGAPLLEFRPTLSDADTVHEAWHGCFGGLRGEDDDGDGRIDEELLNGRDDDGDGEVDEDFRMVGQQMLACDYTDDQPEAKNVYANGELHRPLGLSVHQEAYAWSYPGFDGIAGLQFTITNHGTSALREVYLGLYADLDVTARSDRAGHTNDVVTRLGFTRSFFKDTSFIIVEGDSIKQACFDRIGRTLAVVTERPGSPTPDLPVVTVLPLEHTRDPLGYFVPAVARAPARDAFRVSVFASDRTPTTGAPPRLDADRYAALTGAWPQSPDGYVGDQSLLVSCGPFPRLEPGQSVDFALALVTAPKLESLQVALGNAAALYRGIELNLLPDNQGPKKQWWITGDTGLNGHEVCLEPPPGVEFTADPDCALKFGEPPGIRTHLYRSGECYWTDADCDACTGLNGRETVLRWQDPYVVPPSPTQRVTVGDRSVRIEWDNLPEILVAAGKAGPKGGKFLGYRVYRLDDWRNRTSILPPRENWAALATYGADTRDSKQLIASITDTTLEYDRYWYGQKHYPVGHYVVTDHEAKNGFDYLYLVTTVVERSIEVYPGHSRVDHFESPLVASFDQRVVPRVESHKDALGIWVVPNPFRGTAGWDRPPINGDRLSRHIDFMGLPRARCVIRIWTLAGDHVATLEHDGTDGSGGEAAWDLISRKGQDVASGIYIYTVESSLGNATGRFVVIR